MRSNGLEKGRFGASSQMMPISRILSVGLYLGAEPIFIFYVQNNSILLFNFNE